MLVHCIVSLHPCLQDGSSLPHATSKLPDTKKMDPVERDGEDQEQDGKTIYTT